MIRLVHAWIAAPVAVELFAGLGQPGPKLRRLGLLTLAGVILLGFDYHCLTYGPLDWPATSALLVAGLAFSLQALVAHRFTARVELLMVAWSLMFASLVALGIGREEGMLFMGFASCGTLYVVASQVAERIESHRGTPVRAGTTDGLGVQYPKESGLILTALLLMGCAPGSLLFFIEDEILGQTLGETPWLCFGIALSALMISICSYQAYTTTFYGMPQEGEASTGSLLRYRLLLAAVILMGFVSL